jgi:GNAT superfamily N-acetyltransferase
MIIEIDFDTIYPIWKQFLWPERISKIESNSAMNYLGGYALQNLDTKPTFFAYVIKDEIVGVNSGHLCLDKSYRSRGLYVSPNYRKQGIGTKLLLASIIQAEKENAKFVWSYPKLTAHKTYLSAGFTITSDWEQSELGQNAYCFYDLSNRLPHS